MDPRSPVTSEVLAQQFQLAHQIYDEIVEGRRALAEVRSVQRQLVAAQQHSAAPNELKSALAEAQSSLDNILADTTKSSDHLGLQDAYRNLASALRVVESGDRPVPAQAIAVYEEGSQQVKARIRQWTTFKQERLPQLNQRLPQANLAPITVPDLGKNPNF